MSESFKLGGSQLAAEINDAGEFFADLADHTCELLTARDISEQDAMAIVGDLILYLAQTFHGESFYVTKKPVEFARQMAALADLRYMSYKDVDLKYGWSSGYSLKLKQKIKEKKQRREQLRLPFLDV